MLTLPILLACALALIATCLLYRPDTRWVGLLIMSVLSAWVALICGAGVVLAQNEVTASALGVAATIVGFVALALFLLSLTRARVGWRGHQIDG